MGKEDAQKNTAPARIRAILAELDRVASDYTEARATFDTARTHFEAAREKFAAVKRIAKGVLSWNDLYEWEQQNRLTKFAGMEIGEAILGALGDHALLSAIDVATNPAKEFNPRMSLSDIEEALESGGFEFKTTTAKREINGALLKLAGVHKVGATGYYEAENALETLETIAGKEAVEAVTAKNTAASDDEAPF